MAKHWKPPEDMIQRKEERELELLIKRMEITRIKDISETNVNYFLKGLLFAQEIYVHSSIDHFYENYEDKYRFLFNHDSATDEIFFQGGSAEGLSILRIEEFPETTSE